MSKKSQKTKKKTKASLKLPSIYPSSEWLHHHSNTGTDEGERAVGTRFHEAVSLLISDCVD